MNISSQHGMVLTFFELWANFGVHLHAILVDSVVPSHFARSAPHLVRDVAGENGISGKSRGLRNSTLIKTVWSSF